MPALDDARRLTALHATNLLDTAPDWAFDRLTERISTVLGVPVSLISLVDDKRQFFKSAYGLGTPEQPIRETPLSHSFCQHVVGQAKPLVIEDARNEPLLKDNLAIRDLDVVAYLGVPLYSDEGMPIGSVCAIDNKPHEWSEQELRIVREICRAVMSEIRMQRRIEELQQNASALRTVNDDLFDRSRHLETQLSESTAEFESQEATLLSTTDDLADRDLEVQNLALALTDAEHEERHRIAQLLHDHLQPHLYSSRLRLDLTRKHTSTDRLRKQVDLVIDELDEAILQTRSLAQQLSPPVLSAQGLGAALEQLAAQMEDRFDFIVSLDVEPELPTHPPGLIAFAYQAIRELLFNAVKHAGVAHAAVTVGYTHGQLTLRVQDRGKGLGTLPIDSAKKGTGFGLSAIMRRAQLLNGHFGIDASHHPGTAFLLRLPMPAHA